jgi:tetratricopeptide (TPR) repeat protein
MGLVLTKTGNKEEAIREFKQAIALEERLIRTVPADAPADENLLAGLATSYSRLSSVLSTTDADAAVEVFSKLITIQRELVEADPINRLYQADLARSYTNLGFVLCGRKDWKNAELCYGDAILIQENLLSASPFAAAYRRDLAISYNNLGMLQSRSGNLQQAVSSFRAAEQLQGRLLADAPSDVQLLSNQGSVLNNLGLALDRMGDAAAAESEFRDAIQYQKQALEATSDDAPLRVLLSRHYFNYGRSLRKQEKFDEAVTAAIERSALWPGDSERLISVADELATNYSAMLNVPSASQASKDRCVRAAVSVLRKALVAGLSAERLQTPDLARLASHESYRALLNELELGGPSPPSTHHAQVPNRDKATKSLSESSK